MVDPTPPAAKPTPSPPPQTFNPISAANAIITWVMHHWIIILVLLAVVALGVLAWFLISRVRIVRGKELAVKHAVQACVKDAMETGIRFKQLHTRGNQRRPSQIYGKCYLKGNASLFFAVLQPKRGLFKSFRRRLLLLAPHHVKDLRGKVLEVNAIGISRHAVGRHGSLSWPDDDLLDPAVYAAWETLLRSSAIGRQVQDGYRPGRPFLTSDIYDWYAEAFGIEVAAQQRFKGMDITYDNMKSGMSENLLHKKGAGIDGMFDVLDHDEGAPQGQEQPSSDSQGAGASG